MLAPYSLGLNIAQFFFSNIIFSRLFPVAIFFDTPALNFHQSISTMFLIAIACPRLSVSESCCTWGLSKGTSWEEGIEQLGLAAFPHPFSKFHFSTKSVAVFSPFYLGFFENNFISVYVKVRIHLPKNGPDSNKPSASGRWALRYLSLTPCPGFPAFLRSNHRHPSRQPPPIPWNILWYVCVTKGIACTYDVQSIKCFRLWACHVTCQIFTSSIALIKQSVFFLSKARNTPNIVWVFVIRFFHLPVRSPACRGSMKTPRRRLGDSIPLCGFICCLIIALLLPYFGGGRHIWPLLHDPWDGPGPESRVECKGRIMENMAVAKLCPNFIFICLHFFIKKNKLFSPPIFRSQIFPPNPMDNFLEAAHQKRHISPPHILRMTLVYDSTRQQVRMARKWNDPFRLRANCPYFFTLIVSEVLILPCVIVILFQDEIVHLIFSLLKNLTFCDSGCGDQNPSFHLSQAETIRNFFPKSKGRKFGGAQIWRNVSQPNKIREGGGFPQKSSPARSRSDRKLNEATVLTVTWGDQFFLWSRHSSELEP